MGGDLGFDPLGFKPEDPAEFRLMQEKELSHCRLAMIAAVGFLAQEGVTGQHGARTGATPPSEQPRFGTPVAQYVACGMFLIMRRQKVLYPVPSSVACGRVRCTLLGFGK